VQSALNCSLCGAAGAALFHSDRRREYLQCPRCALVFVPGAYHLSREEEKAEYDKHCNDPADAGYRRFLSRLCLPLCERLPRASEGLDFGCGPGPTLSLMLEERGHSMALYDPFFFSNPGWRYRNYDFITATEVVEHLAQPGVVLEELWSRLRPLAYLGVMTKLVKDAQAFTTWHYKNDSTHVSFFSVQSWQWWARRYHARLEIMGADVILLQKV
jgi:hypothetical protein